HGVGRAGVAVGQNPVYGGAGHLLEAVRIEDRSGRETAAQRIHVWFAIDQKWVGATGRSAVADNHLVEVAVSVRINGNRGSTARRGGNGAHHHVLVKLLESHEQETLVSAIVDFGNPYWPTGGEAVVVTPGGSVDAGIGLGSVKDVVRGVIV